MIIGQIITNSEHKSVNIFLSISFHICFGFSKNEAVLLSTHNICFWWEIRKYFLSSFLASGDFCSLLMIFTNSLDPDQDRQNIGPDRILVLMWTQTICICLKGTATLMISMFYQKELYEPWILIQVSSKSDEKCASYGHLKNAIWPAFNRHFEYLISFQKFFNCLVFSYFDYYIICVSADMQLYTQGKCFIKD